MVVTATTEEYEIAKKRFPQQDIILTGVGGVNVVERLKGLDRKTKIINFGYVGSNLLPIGTEVKIGLCQLYHPKVEYQEPTYRLKGDYKCYTSSDFVTETHIKEPVVFDMELAYILALGFDDVQSIKIVSDNLSYEQYIRNMPCNNGHE